jgi:glucose/arabinose dehydrogenase
MSFNVPAFFSRAATCLILLPLLTNPLCGQVSNPVPDPIVTGTVSVGLELIATLPDTQADVSDGRNTNTRINFYRETDDGRRFVNEQRGVLYELDSAGNPTEYANLRDTFTRDIYTGSFASGFTSFTFHPEFSTNGLFYTIHSETPNGSPVPDHIPATYTNNDVNFQAVVTEWNATNPAAGTFSGTRRELLRVGMTANNAIHPIGDVSFNPTASVGDADYGMLYIAGGDWAISTLNDFDALQRLDTLPGTMMRIDPRSPSVTGGMAGLGDYTIPADNPFVGVSGALGEIYAYGFRNAHRVSWDAAGNMYAMDIGQSQLEEINVVVAGGNYGWGEREGTFVNGQAVNGNRSVVFAGDPGPGFIDPVAQYDHDEGAAIAGGFAYEGTLVPELQGKFILGDIVDGRLLYCDVADLLDGDPDTEATIFELQLVVNDTPATMQSLVGGGRVDMRLGQTNSGEIVVLAKEDGSVRQFTTLNDDPIGGTDGWALIDDFQGLAAGDLIEGTTGPGATWTGNMAATNSAQADPDCVANMAMQLPGEANPSALRAAFTDATTNIAAGATGTLFYRFRTPDSTVGTSDNVIGLTDNPDLTNFNFKAGLRNIVPAGNQLDLRDGGSYEEVAQLADNTWYRLWLVAANTNPGTFEVYLQSDTDPNFATQTLLVGDDVFDFRINDATDIINVYFRNANNPGGVAGNSIYIDDIYINSSQSDLSTPENVGVCSTVVLKGDVNIDGSVTFLDIAPFIAVLSASEFQAEADCDCDGDVDFLDIQPFIDILAGN